MPRLCRVTMVPVGYSTSVASNCNASSVQAGNSYPIAALQDVVGGRIDVMCPSPASSLAMVQSGLLRAYAVTDGTRLASAPDIPTVDEAGFPQLHLSVWGGLFVPKGTPKSVIAKLNSAAATALVDPAAR